METCCRIDKILGTSDPGGVPKVKPFIKIKKLGFEFLADSGEDLKPTSCLAELAHEGLLVQVSYWPIRLTAKNRFAHGAIPITFRMLRQSARTIEILASQDLSRAKGECVANKRTSIQE